MTTEELMAELNSLIDRLDAANKLVNEARFAGANELHPTNASTDHRAAVESAVTKMRYAEDELFRFWYEHRNKIKFAVWDGETDPGFAVTKMWDASPKSPDRPAPTDTSHESGRFNK